MSKKLFILVIGCFSIWGMSALAQNFFQTKPQPLTSPGPGLTGNAQPATPSQVLSDQDFKSKINTLSKASQDSLNNAINTQLKPTPPVAKPSPTTTTPPPDATKPEAAAPAPPVPIELDKSSTSITTTAPKEALRLPTTQATPEPSPPSAQPYTGFGTPKSNDKGSSGKSTGGFNINY